MKSWSDHALNIVGDDRLSRTRLVESLAGLLGGNGLETPLTVGIYGDWGSGKTTVMRMLKKELENDNANKTVCLWFDAWKFARAEHSLWRALLLAVIDEIDQHLPKSDDLDAKLGKLRDNLFRSLTTQEKGDLRINWNQALPFTIDAGIRLMTAGLGDKLGIGEVFKDLFGDKAETLSAKDAKEAMTLIERSQSEHYHAQITAIDQFEKVLSELIKETLVKQHHRRLVVFVDDLDRCLPSDAITALEAVKLFFDIEGCLFVLGMDRDVVERGILERFPPIGSGDSAKLRVDPRKYLDKIVQIPVTLPPLTEKQVGVYLDDLFGRPGVDTRLKACRDLIETAVPPNPRTLKRVLNVLALLIPLRGGDEQDARYLAKIVLLQVIFDDAYQAVRRKPLDILELEKEAKGDTGVSDKLKELMATAPSLKSLLGMHPKFEGLGEETLIELVAQVEITGDSSNVG